MMTEAFFPGFLKNKNKNVIVEQTGADWVGKWKQALWHYGSCFLKKNWNIFKYGPRNLNSACARFMKLLIALQAS